MLEKFEIKQKTVLRSQLVVWSVSSDRIAVKISGRFQADFYDRSGTL